MTIPKLQSDLVNVKVQQKTHQEVEREFILEQLSPSTSDIIADMLGVLHAKVSRNLAHIQKVKQLRKD